MIPQIASIALFLVSGASAYATCDPIDYPYRGQTVPPIPLIATQVSFNGTSYSVSGTIEIVDGCTFRFTNYQLSGTGLLATTRPVFYGSFPGQTQGYSLTDDTPVELTTGTPRTQTFTFTRRAGAAMSFTEFTEFRLFHVGTSTLLGRATIPNASVNPPSVSSAVPPTTTDAAQPVTTITTTTKPKASVSPSGVPKVSSGISVRSEPFVVVFATLLAFFVLL